ncbi:MAG: PEP-CTERM sorting domain-containing protein [Burkholderiaceae bacterium]|nr:PEP-CTERM sorting domain-containing protein [Burkholderiaceae bacterium]
MKAMKATAAAALGAALRASPVRAVRRGLLAAILLGAVHPTSANAYVIDWIGGTAASASWYFDRIDTAAGSTGTVVPTSYFNLGDNTLMLRDGSTTVVTSGGPGERRMAAHVTRISADFQIHRTEASEIPVAQVVATAGGFASATAFPEAEGHIPAPGSSGGDYVMLYLRSYVTGTGLWVGDDKPQILEVDLDGLDDDGLALSTFFYGRDSELLAVDTTYTFTVDVYALVSRYWDGSSARYGTAAYDYMYGNLAVVPEPSVPALFGLGLAGLGMVRASWWRGKRTGQGER